jgi:hypothetical protein
MSEQTTGQPAINASAMGSPKPSIEDGASSKEQLR